MEQYLELDSGEFEKSILKLGFCRRKDGWYS
jgi:predicted RNA binding protein YcfA (HicA-like mRNA interferase family)